MRTPRAATAPRAAGGASAAPERGEALLGIARRAIASALALDPPGADPQAPWLEARGAAFVTLTVGGELRGCIGTVEAYRPLGEDVRANAVAAAVRDPRFPPLEPRELARTRIAVSVLSPPAPLHGADEREALAEMRPGIDGIVLERGGRRAVFLPQVWDQLPAPRAFLSALRRKAGLPEHLWDADLRLYRFTVEKYAEARDGEGTP